MKEKIINVGREKIAVYESSGNGQNILFLHGNSMSSDNFIYQFNSSLADEYHLIAFDLPGHGKSSASSNPDEVYSLPGYASITIEIIEQLKLDEVVLVGYSLGGHIILECSNNVPQIKGALIFGTPPATNPVNIGEIYYNTPVLNIIFNDQLSYEEIDIYTGIIFKDKEISELTKKIIKDSDPRVRSFLGKSIMECKFLDEVEVVKNLKYPLAIIQGLADPLVCLEYIEGLSIPTMWNGEVQKIKNVGHSPQIDSPDDFNNILREFIGYLIKMNK